MASPKDGQAGIAVAPADPAIAEEADGWHGVRLGRHAIHVLPSSFSSPDILQLVCSVFRNELELAYNYKTRIFSEVRESALHGLTVSDGANMLKMFRWLAKPGHCEWNDMEFQIGGFHVVRGAGLNMCIR
jgi:hypothetical protein